MINVWKDGKNDRDLEKKFANHCDWNYWMNYSYYKVIIDTLMEPFKKA